MNMLKLFCPKSDVTEFGREIDVEGTPYVIEFYHYIPPFFSEPNKKRKYGTVCTVHRKVSLEMDMHKRGKNGLVVLMAIGRTYLHPNDYRLFDFEIGERQALKRTVDAGNEYAVKPKFDREERIKIWDSWNKSLSDLDVIFEE